VLSTQPAVVVVVPSLLVVPVSLVSSHEAV
jgi:hypothetical protein